MPFQCSHCMTEIPEDSYVCAKCGKVCREKVTAVAGAARQQVAAEPVAKARRPAPVPGSSVKPKPKEPPRPRILPKPPEKPAAAASFSEPLDLPVAPPPEAAGRSPLTVGPELALNPNFNPSPLFDLGTFKLDLSGITPCTAQLAGGPDAPLAPAKQLSAGDFLERLKELLAAADGPVAPYARPARRAALVACLCPSQNRLLDRSAAEDPAGFLILRAPGGFATETNGALPALHSALLAYGVTEVVLLAHENCRLDGLTNADLLNEIRETGHRRAAFPDDLRAAAGGFRSTREALNGSCALLAERTPAFAGVPVHGLLAQADGTVRVVVNGYRRFAADEGK